MIKLRIRMARARRYRCDVSGCRALTPYLISKRDDVASHPLHLCADCIRGLAVILAEMDGETAAEAAEIALTDATEPADGTDAVTVDDAPEEPAEGITEGAEKPQPTAEPEPEPKPAARRARARNNG